MFTDNSIISCRSLILCLGLYINTYAVLAQNSLDNLDVQDVRIQFEFPSKKVKGSFEPSQLPSEVSLDPEAAELWKALIPVESIKTGNGIRDWHLMSKKYFHRKAHPEMIFEGKSLSPSGDAFLLIGNLTIKGIRKELTLRITPSPEAADRFTAKGTLYSSDFDIFIKKKREENRVLIQLDFILKAKS